VPGGSRQILGDVGRTRRDGRITHRRFAVACQHKDRSGSHANAQGDVGRFVADDERSRRVQVEIGAGPMDQARRGLPAIAGLGRGVRAMKDAVDANSRGGQGFGEMAMDVTKLVLGEQAPADSRLIRHDDQGISGTGKLPEGLDGPWEKGNLRGVGKIMPFLDERSVAIQKDGGFRHGVVTSGRIQGTVKSESAGFMATERR